MFFRQLNFYNLFHLNDNISIINMNIHNALMQSRLTKDVKLTQVLNKLKPLTCISNKSIRNFGGRGKYFLFNYIFLCHNW